MTHQACLADQRRWAGGQATNLLLHMCELKGGHLRWVQGLGARPGIGILRPVLILARFGLEHLATDRAVYRTIGTLLILGATVLGLTDLYRPAAASMTGKPG